MTNLRSVVDSISLRWVTLGGDAVASGTFRSVVVAALIAGFSGLAPAQERDEAPDPTILRIALADASTTLEQGMAASERNGQPISAQFEMPNGDLQLSVYTANADGCIETVLDPKAGAIISAQPITDADDLARAKAYKAVMDKAMTSLRAAIERAIQENAGTRAIGIVPELRNGQPVAVVRLQRPRGFLTVWERLN